MDSERGMICRSNDLADGAAGVRFELDRGGERLSAFAVRHGGRVRAYLNRCAHVGVELDWVPGVFFDDTGQFLVCATHGATYEPDTGLCVYGPCKGRRLETIDTVEQGGNIYIK
jgi:nitrite reductase/ring-hydroxylating ferredoxin subunit